MTGLGGGDGFLAAIVWPAYIGVAEGVNGTCAEPIGHPDYERGQIIWTPVDDQRQIIGRARILCPPGVYTHFVYFHHPTQQRLCGVVQMDHPATFTAPVTVLDVDPIENSDLQLADQLRGP